MAIAFFITFATYGTWLHGTDRGFGSVDLDHNGCGEPYVEPDQNRESAARERMTQPPYLLDGPRRAVVRDAIVALARDRGWHLRAVHVRSNHVHLVVGPDGDPDRMMADLKARASRMLTKAGFESAERKRWARHGSTRHLRTGRSRR